MTHTPSDASMTPQSDTHELPIIRVVQISDLHLKPDDADRLGRFHEILAMAVALEPDVIVLSGDLTEQGFDVPEDLTWAKSIIQSIHPPLLLIPGNHDIGDKTGQGPNAINAQRLANWTHTFASDHFVQDRGPWRLIGINSLLIGSELPEEHIQLRWLDQMIDQAQMLGQQVAVFMHEPPFLIAPGHSTNDRSEYWPIATDKQELYMKRLSRPIVKLVASGHVHAYHTSVRNGVSHVWCPSPAFIIHDRHFDPAGEVTGFIVHTLLPDQATHTLVPLIRHDTQVIPFNPAAEISP